MTMNFDNIPDAILELFPEYASSSEFYDPEDRKIPHVFFANFIVYLSQLLQSKKLSIESPAVASLFNLIEALNTSSDPRAVDFVRSGFLEGMTGSEPEDELYREAAKKYFSPALYDLFRFVASRRAGTFEEFLEYEKSSKGSPDN